jgi:peptidyl-prolyl cis-trans isomerase SurA
MNKPRTFLLALLLLAGAAAMNAQQVVDEIVAVVNDDIITLSQYKARYDLMVQAATAQLQGADRDKQIEAIKKGLLDQMVSDLLLLQMAKDRQIDPKEQLKLYVENIKKQNNMESDDDLRAAVTREGLDYNVWLKQTEEDIMRQAVIYTEVDRHIAIDDAETVSYYKSHLDRFVEPAEYKLRAIVLTQEGADEAGLETKKKEILDKLAAAGDFSALAAEYNQAPLKESKGDLGKIKKTELEATLEQAAAKLKAGEVSPWVKARSGWYLLKLEERQDSRQKTYEEVKQNVENFLFQQKKTKALTIFFDKQKAGNYVKILRPNPLGN